MGELPIFTCQAHVFTINPQTKKSWIPSSSKAVDVNFFYDSSKHCYRIISVEDSPGCKKVIINSTLTEKMIFKKTSQKFGQWADSKTGAVHGLGFGSEADLTKFVNQFKQCVESMKTHSTESGNSSSCNTRGSEHISVVPDGTTQNGVPLTLSPTSMNSITHATLQTIPSPPMPMTFANPTDTSPNQSVQHQLRIAQAQVRRLEMELNSAKRQAPPGATYNGSYLSNFSNPESGKVTDSDAEVCTGINHPDFVGVNDYAVNRSPKPYGQISSTQLATQIRGAWTDRPSQDSVRSLYLRLGNILREAVELHNRLGLLLPHATPGAPPE